MRLFKTRLFADPIDITVPAEGDVRSGVVYGPDDALTGTAVVVDDPELDDPANIQQELEYLIAAALWSALGASPIRSIISQVAPDYENDIGTVLHGTGDRPFLSISSVLPEEIDNSSGTNCRAKVVRPVTCILISDKVPCETSAHFEALRLYRQQAIKVLNLSTLGSDLETDTLSTIRMAKVRPRSQVETAAWYDHGKFIGSFDVLVELQEKMGV